MPAGEVELQDFEQFVVRIGSSDQTIILHESEHLPDSIRVDA